MFIEKQQQQIYGHTTKITYNSNIHHNHRQTLYCFFFFLQKWNSKAYSNIFISIEPLLYPGILLGTWNIQESNSDKTKQKQQNCDFMVLTSVQFFNLPLPPPTPQHSVGGFPIRHIYIYISNILMAEYSTTLTKQGNGLFVL